MAEELRTKFGAYQLEETAWNMHINSSVPNVTVNGFIQDVVASLTPIHPEYMAAVEKVTLPDSISADSHGSPGGINGRWRNPDWTLTLNPTNGICGIGAGDALEDSVNDGIKYLNQLQGTPQLGQGPGNCSRVSCSWASAIYWCNDNSNSKLLSSFSDIAYGAQLVIGNCGVYDTDDGSGTAINGQQFFEDGWNVMVMWASC
ncbi:unnamed protein product [Discula destructiva]